MTEADLLLALRDCYDPVLKRNLVELGLIRSVSLRRDLDAPGIGVGPRYIASVTLTAPSADEDATAQLHAQILNRLAGIPDLTRTELTLLPALFPILR